jgi:hypothetical protein
MSVTGRSEKEGTALDVVMAEDVELRRLFAALRVQQGSSVEERARYGETAKRSSGTSPPARRPWSTWPG